MSTIEARLSSIYAAAHEDLPAQAADFARHAEILGAAIGPAAAHAQAAGAYGLGDNITALGDELFVRLRIMVRTLNESAIGLDRIADDFASTDEAAVEWISNHRKWLETHPAGARPDVPSLPSRPDGQAAS